jgi:hypothetical protein
VYEDSEQRFTDRPVCDASASVEGMYSTTFLLLLHAVGVRRRQGGMERGDAHGRGTGLEGTPHVCICLALIEASQHGSGKLLVHAAFRELEETVRERE